MRSGNKGALNIAFGAAKKKASSKNSSGADKIEKRVFFDDGQLGGRSDDDVTHGGSGNDAMARGGRTGTDDKRRVRQRRNNRKSLASRLALGRTGVFVGGKSGTRALSAIMKVCSVCDVVVSEDGVSFFVPSKLLPQIVALLDNLCYDYKIIGVKGVAPALVRALSRAGLIVGIVAFAVLLAIYPLFVTRVSVTDVNGEALDGALNAQVEQILSSFGISEGKMLAALDADAVGKKLLAIEGVAYAGVERHGTHISVLIKRERKGEAPFEIKGSTVTATRTATVTRVIVEGGTAAVKYGDVIRRGDVLIEGYTLYGEDKIPVEAKGRVYGKVLLRSEVIFPDIALEKTYGEVKRVEKLGFFGKIPSTPKSPFAQYELSVKRSELGFLVPMSCYLFEFREISRTQKKETRSDDELIHAVYSSLLAELEEEATLTAVYDSATREGNARRVSVTLEAEVLVSG